MWIGLIILITLVIVCALLGAIYAYIYFTKIKPRAHLRPRGHVIEQQPLDDDGFENNHGGGGTSGSGGPTQRPEIFTHLFLFRK